MSKLPFRDQGSSKSLALQSQLQLLTKASAKLQKGWLSRKEISHEADASALPIQRSRAVPLLLMQAANPNPNGDLLLSQPTDTVSALAWSPVPQGGGNTELIHLLAASTWDGNLHFYRVSAGGQFEAAQTAAHKAPILDVAWALVR